MSFKDITDKDIDSFCSKYISNLLHFNENPNSEELREMIITVEDIRSLFYYFREDAIAIFNCTATPRIHKNNAKQSVMDKGVICMSNSNHKLLISQKVDTTKWE